MRHLIAVLTFTFTSTLALAQSAPTGNRCEKYFGNMRFMKAINTVAERAQWTLEEMCTLERIWDVQADATVVVNSRGEEEPHVRVQLHSAYDSCLYMVRDADQAVTSKRCFSTF